MTRAPRRTTPLGPARLKPARRGLARLGLASVLLVGACGPAATTEPASSTAPPADATAGPSASPSGPARVRFEFQPEAVLNPEMVGSTALYINPGALIELDGTLHMFPNLFSKWPGRVEVPHLTSTDGVTWTLDRDAGDLSSDDFPLADPGIDVSAGFVTGEGTWVLVYETVSSTRPWVIGQATAPSPQGPWTVDEEPVVTPGPQGSWDAGGVRWPSVVATPDGWAMHFAGFDFPEGGSGSIGLATSTDGVTWLKREAPALTAEERWEGRSLDRPRVVSTADGYVMVYAGRDLTDRGLATSSDAIAWTRLPGPVIEQSDFPTSGRSWDAALHFDGESLAYYLEIGFETTAIYRATLDWP